ncbi:hypothetical protein [Microbacterium sp. NPDC096154]|uniref:hypothetical protein n=1 Tax=Microbacterium sp. NPDC096154 TaxID=3155549 RepID=UPI003330CD2A
MAEAGRASLADRSRAWRVALAAVGGVWAAIILPFPASDWGDWSWLWIEDIYDYPLYARIATAVGDPYIVFGALAGLSFLLIGVALLPDLSGAGWGGRLLAWLVIAGAPITALSYVGAPEQSPLHFMWGWEGLLLLAIGLAGPVAAITARSRWPRWVRVLLGLTLLVVVVGVLTFGYWPHGSLVLLAAEAVAVILGAPRGAGDPHRSAPDAVPSSGRAPRPEG